MVESNSHQYGRRRRRCRRGVSLQNNNNKVLRMIVLSVLLIALQRGQQQQTGGSWGRGFLQQLLPVADAQQTCSLTEQDLNRVDPALKEFTYDVGDGPQKMMVYVEPDVTDMYNGKPPSTQKVTPKFNGLAGKFINLSNKQVSLYWESSRGGTRHEMRHHMPFAPSGTATFPGHRFLFTELKQPDKVLKLMVVKDYPNNIYYYDPYLVEDDPQQTEENLKVLTDEERAKYDLWRKTLSFHEQYLNFTGRSYLSYYKRDPPMHYLWPADHFGQEHWVTTRETHFSRVPPEDLLGPIDAKQNRKLAHSDPRILSEYRDPAQGDMLNLTLKVLSVAPRVFDIQDFLSDAEVAHILNIAANIDLKLSITGEAGDANELKVEEDSRRTRTSFNSWVPREKTPIIDAIYRRAADVMRIDEAMFRERRAHEIPDMENKKTVAEQLQLVHYDFKQEYTGHHDFGYSALTDEKQSQRFATLLLYLNEGMTGGETSFPRYANAETFRDLRVTPKRGRAVLFYSQLPDGNFDDFSQHAALPVTDGEKWLINLWVWDPAYRE